MSSGNFRLPTNVRPVDYDLFFDVDLKNFKFAGKEIIDIEVKSASEIVLNAVDLEIKHVSISYRKRSLKPKIKLEPENETITLKFNEKVNGQAKLILEFNGRLNDNPVGFYRSKYTTKNHSEKYLATTHFE